MVLDDRYLRSTFSKSQTGHNHGNPQGDWTFTVTGSTSSSDDERGRLFENLPSPPRNCSPASSTAPRSAIRHFRPCYRKSGFMTRTTRGTKTA